MYVKKIILRNKLTIFLFLKKKIKHDYFQRNAVISIVIVIFFVKVSRIQESRCILSQSRQGII